MTNKKIRAAQVILIVFSNLLLFVAWKIHYEPVKNLLTSSPEFQLLVQYKSTQPDNLEKYITPVQRLIDVLHYDINIDLHPEKEIIDGDVTVTGLLLDRSATQIDLNLYENMRISGLWLNGKVAEYEQDDTRLTIPLKSFDADTFKIRVKYEGKPKKLGFASFSFDKFDNKSVVFTLNEPVFASTWYPCDDRPDDKALVDISITNDSSKVSVSNGTLVDIKTRNDRRTYHWKTHYPISTYLTCFYSADYSHFNEKYVTAQKDSMNIDYYAFPEHLDMAKEDFKGHPAMISFFSGIFGEYPFIREKYGVAEFLWQMGAMEHQTITGIGSNFLNGRRFFNEFYIHELAHQWWGDAVSPATWKDIWLNEGFASYCEALYAEHEYGFAAYKSTMQGKFSSHFRGTLYNPQSGLFSSTVYDKGAWVVHMLRWELGDSTFFSTLRRYYEKFKYKNASTQDFIKVCEDVSHRDLGYFFRQWVFDGDESIKLSYNWKQVDSGSNNQVVRISVKQEQTHYPVFKFPLEVSIKLDNQENEQKQVVYVDSREKEIEIKTAGSVNDVKLDPDGRLLADITRK